MTKNLLITYVIINSIVMAGLQAKTQVVQIGVANYYDKRIEDLRYTKNDIDYFKNVYKATHPTLPSESFLTLLDEKANYNEIRNTMLNKSLSELTEEDTLIFYLTGHGTKKKINGSYYQLYALYDSSPDNCATFLFEEELYQWAMMIKAKTKIFIFDTCSPMNFSFDNWRNGLENFIILSATTENYSALESTAFKHSYFSYLLGKGIKGGADTNKDNKIDFFELKTYIQKNIEMYSKQFISQPYLNGDPNLLNSFFFPVKNITNKGMVIYTSKQYSLVDLGETEVTNQLMVLNHKKTGSFFPILQLYPLYCKINSTPLIKKGDILIPQKTSFFGNLIIDAAPWAIVEIDNKAYGFSPIRIKRLEAKEYIVKLIHPNYGSKKRTILIEPGKTFKLKVKMDEKE